MSWVPMAQDWFLVGKEVAGRQKLLGMAIVGCTGKSVTLVSRSRLTLSAAHCLRDKGTGVEVYGI